MTTTKNKTNTKKKATVKRKRSNVQPEAKAVPVWVKLAVSFALVVIGFLLPKALSAYPDFVEKVFSNGLYSFLSSVFGFINSLIPFSLTEVVIIALLIAAITLIVIVIVKIWNHKLVWKRFFSFFLSIILIGSVMFASFYFLWGFNYHRNTLSSALNLKIEKHSQIELLNMCLDLSEQANSLRENLFEVNGVFRMNDYSASFKKISKAYEKLGNTYPIFDKKVYPAKSVLFSKAMSYTGTSGMFMPFLFEANVNINQPSLLIPSAAAHENAHFLGICREDEANFSAYLACSVSEDTEIQYSGIIMALIYAGNKLYETDSDAYYSLYSSYSNKVASDLADYNSYWDSFSGPVKDFSSSVNDGYLKYNNQADGEKSYGEMVDLLLAFYYSDAALR